MADLFKASYDPAQLEDDAAAAKANSQDNKAVLQNANYGNAGLLAAIQAALNVLQNADHGNAALRTAIAGIGGSGSSGVDLSGLESGQTAMTALLNEIKGYTDTEIAQIISLAQQISGYTDTLESLLTGADGLSAIKSVLDTVNTNTSDIGLPWGESLFVGAVDEFTLPQVGLYLLILESTLGTHQMLYNALVDDITSHSEILMFDQFNLSEPVPNLSPNMNYTANNRRWIKTAYRLGTTKYPANAIREVRFLG